MLARGSRLTKERELCCAELGVVEVDDFAQRKPIVAER